MSSENGDTSNLQMIKPGTLLLKCDPLVYVGHLAPPILCDTCLAMEAAVGFKLKRCSFCHVVYYCNVKCQKKGWKDGHKYECEHLMSFLTSLPTGNKLAWMPRMLLRLVIKLQDGKDYYGELEVDGTKIQRRFDDLMSKLESEECRQNGDGKMALDIMIATVKHILGDNDKIQLPDDDQLHKMSCRILTNMIGITNNWFYRVGSGLYLAGSIFDHSCRNMAVATFQGTTMHVRNVTEIPKSLPITKVTISYLENSLMPTEERRKILKDQWYFNCDCEMCQTGGMDKEIRSIICPNEECKNEIDSEEMRKPCNSCGHTMGEDVIAEVLEAEDDVRKLLKVDELELETIEESIEKLERNHFPDKHWLMLRCFIEAMTIASSKAKEEEKVEYWKKTREFAGKYLVVAKRFFQTNELELIRVLLELATSSFALSKDEETEKHLSQAKSIAEVIFGEDSDFIETRIAPDLKILQEVKMMQGMQNLGMHYEPSQVEVSLS